MIDVPYTPPKDKPEDEKKPGQDRDPNQDRHPDGEHDPNPQRSPQPGREPRVEPPDDERIHHPPVVDEPPANQGSPTLH